MRAYVSTSQTYIILQQSRGNQALRALSTACSDVLEEEVHELGAVGLLHDVFVEGDELLLEAVGQLTLVTWRPGEKQRLRVDEVQSDQAPAANT